MVGHKAEGSHSIIIFSCECSVYIVLIHDSIRLGKIEL